MNRRVAILGATGLVGQTTLRVLEQRDFPTEAPRLLASDGNRRALHFRGRELPVEAVGPQSFDGIEIALFAVANPISEQWAGPAQAAGARVVDNSSAFRYHDGVPLVVPEVNGALLEHHPTLVANPNCSTIAIVMALAPLARVARLERVVVSTYQSVSGGGAEALAELESGVREPARHSSSAICTAFKAAPFLRLSEAMKNSRALGCERSRRARPTSTSSRPSAASGVG